MLGSLKRGCAGSLMRLHQLRSPRRRCRGEWATTFCHGLGAEPIAKSAADQDSGKVDRETKALCPSNLNQDSNLNNVLDLTSTSQ